MVFFNLFIGCFQLTLNGRVVKKYQYKKFLQFCESFWLDREKNKSQNSICEGKAAI